MKIKVLQIKMPDKSVWEVPAHLVAKDRAEYYCSVDEEATYQDEFEKALTYNDDLIEWAQNHMDWEDVQASARIVEPPDVDYLEGWVNGRCEVVEVEWKGGG